MARDMDAYRASLDSPSEEFPSTRRRRQRGPRPWSKRLLSVFSLLFLVGVVIAVVLVIQKSGNKDKSVGGNTNNSASNNSSNNSTSNNSTSTTSPTTSPSQSTDQTQNTSTQNSGSSTSSSACAERRPPAHKRTVVFWQSEVAGCEKVPSGVTHVVFGFALVDGSGRVNATFQNTDDEIVRCVKALRANCIASLGSIGGSTNNDAIANVTNADAFAASAVALVEKFGFDGVDIDDETVGPAFNASRVVAFVKATRKALDAKDETLLLTYDGYFNEGEPSFCTSVAYASYTRCFPTELLTTVDWVNIMAYNVAQDNATAAGIYANALNSTFAEWKTQLNGDFTKATIGVCVDKSCAYGPGPSTAVIAAWNAYARVAGTGGGMMVYATSGEVTEDFAVTRSVLPLQR